MPEFVVLFYHTECTFRLYASIDRWGNDYHNDMAVRMLWSVNDNYENCNHNPIVILNGDKTKDAVIMNVNCGEVIRPDLTGTYDPDGDELACTWYMYKEAGTYSGDVKIENANTDTPTMYIPEDAINDELHIILEVVDNGKNFSLKSYRRLVLRTGEAGFNKPYKYVNDTEFTYFGNWEYKTKQYGSHNGDVHISNTPGDYATLKFKGNRIMLFGGAFEDN